MPSDKDQDLGHLIAALQGSDVHAVGNAALRLAHLAQREPSALSALVNLLAHPDAGVREGAAYALSEVGHGIDPAAPALCDSMIRDSSASVRLLAAKAIRCMRETALWKVWPYLLKVLLDSDETVRREAAVVLLDSSSLASEDISNIAAVFLQSELHQSADRALVMEMLVVSFAGMARLLSLDWLDGVMRSGGVAVRRVVALVIGGYGAEAMSIVERWIHDDDADVRLFLAKGVARTKAGTTLFWVALLRDEDRDVRLEAVSALSALGKNGAVATPELLRLLRVDRDLGVRSSVPSALQAVAGNRHEIVPALLIALAEADRGVRTSAGTALFDVAREAPELFDAGDIREVSKFLTGSVADARYYAAMIVSFLHPTDPDDVAAIMEATRDPDSSVRFWAVHALANAPITADVSHTLTATQTDPDPKVREAATDVLNQIERRDQHTGADGTDG